MGTAQNAAKMCAAKETTQFKLTTNIITKLNTFKLTPTAKLVLLYLTTCYNPKHREVFPKQKTIADKIGVSERSVTRAIQELFKEGLVLIECKYTNRYKFTSKIVSEQPDKMADDIGQNVTEEGDNLSVSYIEPTIEHDKEPQVIDRGGNVYSGDDEILADYAVKHKAKSVGAYITKLKETGSAAKIIKEHRKKLFIAKMAENAQKQTAELVNLYESYKQNSVLPETSLAWVKLGKKLGY